MSTALSTVPGIQAALGRHAKSLLLLWEPPSILLCGPSLQLTCRISGLLHLTPSIFGFLPQLDVITQLRKSSVSPHCPPRTSTLLSVLCNPVCAGHPTLLPDHVPAPSSTCMSSPLVLTPADSELKSPFVPTQPHFFQCLSLGRFFPPHPWNLVHLCGPPVLAGISLPQQASRWDWDTDLHPQTVRPLQ